MTEQPLTKKTVDVLDRRMAYHERGGGRPVLLLHGNPTSSYLWRDVISELDGLGRLIAPDLIGMGDSAKLPNPGPDTYRFTTHRNYLAAFIDAVIGLSDPIVFVVHDWGSALGFDWANHHRDRVRGIAYMEGVVRPIASWDEGSASATPVFQGFRSHKGAATTPDRRRPRRCGADRSRLFAMDGGKRHCKTVRQRRARGHSDRRAQGFLPPLEEPDRSHRPRIAFHSGRFGAPGRTSGSRLDEGQRAVDRPNRELACPSRSPRQAIP